jgi:hypothetical protein
VLGVTAIAAVVLVGIGVKVLVGGGTRVGEGIEVTSKPAATTSVHPELHASATLIICNPGALGGTTKLWLKSPVASAGPLFINCWSQYISMSEFGCHPAPLTATTVPVEPASEEREIAASART